MYGTDALVAQAWCRVTTRWCSAARRAPKEVGKRVQGRATRTSDWGTWRRAREPSSQGRRLDAQAKEARRAGGDVRTRVRSGVEDARLTERRTRRRDGLVEVNVPGEMGWADTRKREREVGGWKEKRERERKKRFWS